MIAFTLLAVLAIAGALATIGFRNPVVSALSLAVTFFAVALVFVVLGAEFLAVIQIVVYAGAILVFFLFVIMLLNLGKLPPGDTRTAQRWLGIYAAFVIGALVLLGVRLWKGGVLAVRGTPPPAGVGNTEALATLLFRDYVFPFEVTSVLLTAAVVGAVVLARRHAQEREAGAAGRTGEN